MLKLLKNSMIYIDSKWEGTVSNEKFYAQFIILVRDIYHCFSDCKITKYSLI